MIMRMMMESIDLIFHNLDHDNAETNNVDHG